MQSRYRNASFAESLNSQLVLKTSHEKNRCETQLCICYYKISRDGNMQMGTRVNIKNNTFQTKWDVDEKSLS